MNRAARRVLHVAITLYVLMSAYGHAREHIELGCTTSVTHFLSCPEHP